MDAELSKGRVCKIEGSKDTDVIWISIAGSVTAGAFFTRKDMMLIHGMIGSVLK